MGKVKVKVIGDEAQEQEQLAEQKQKREQKAAKKAQVKGVGMGGGERISSIGVSEAEILAELDNKPSDGEIKASTEDEMESREAGAGVAGKKARGKKAQAKEARVKSKRYTENSSFVAKATTYPVKNGIEILRKFKKSNFDETVELHINVKEKGVTGVVNLPHGTGKTLRIKVADDALIAEIEKGKIDFDILVATPDMMPKLAKVARVLGPRGLMPNPKNGTISANPAEVIEKLSKGQVTYKTEPTVPVIHMSVGKLSFEDAKLSENISSVISSIGAARINDITLKSTMSPAIKIQA